MAFISPLVLFDWAEFYDRNNNLSPGEEMLARALDNKEGDGEELAQYVRRGKLKHRVEFCCGDSLEYWSGFPGLFKGLGIWWETRERPDASRRSWWERGSGISTQARE